MMAKRDAGRGLTDRKICLAVTFGVACGVVMALLQLNREEIAARGGSLSGVEDGTLERLKEDREQLARENEGLKTELARVRSTLSTKAEAGLILSTPGKAGPPGTVKSQRTNPVVTPDPSINPQLAELLEKVAVNRELIVAVSNNYIRGMLQTWFEGVKRTGVTNFMVVALDDEIAEFCRQHDVPVYRRNAAISAAQKNTGDNHAISGSKFHLLREFLVLGYAVLLSDVDIVYLKNPFHYLYRDCDVESMTDGFDNYTAYGYDDVTDDPSMGWARYAHTMRVFVFNSGLFYIRPTFPSIELLDRVTARLAKENSWDQAVFNEELFFPSHPGYSGLHASRRVLDYYDFMNSKVLFKQVRKDGRFANHVPVTIHVNYHPDKYQRMLAIVDYYVHGNKAALNPFPDGSE